MTTCFIFAKYLDEEQCLSLRFDQHGQVDAPLALRSIHELRLLQIGARTIVVLPTDSSNLQHLELSWLGERKARAAIPYALEEQLAQDVATLHFAFDRQHYQNNHYLVVVTDKQFLMDLMARLDRLDLDFDVITLDWFALRENEVCVTEQVLLINDSLFKGALGGELATIYLGSKENNSELLLFSDSMPLSPNVDGTLYHNLSSVWLAERLLRANLMNICQGDLQHDTRQRSIRQWYWGCAIMAGVLVMSVFLSKIIYLHSLNTRMTDVDKKIAAIYHQFFPEASQVTSPKFRISQLLKSGETTTDTQSLKSLLGKLAQAVKDSPITIKQFHFQRQVLSVTLVSPHFAALENLQQRLQQRGVKVTQAQASSQDHQAAATLELSL